MRLRRRAMPGLAALGLLAAQAGCDAGPQKHEPPYYASIAATKARLRAGPGRNYPAKWLYRRADLPIKVVDVYNDWRKIEDPAGTQGWMLVTLLSSRRTAIVTGGIAGLRAAPDGSAHVNWRAAPGVVGRVSDCKAGWCYLDVRDRGGYVRQSELWGIAPGEEL